MACWMNNDEGVELTMSVLEEKMTIVLEGWRGAGANDARGTKEIVMERIEKVFVWTKEEVMKMSHGTPNCWCCEFCVSVPAFEMLGMVVDAPLMTPRRRWPLSYTQRWMMKTKLPEQMIIVEAVMLSETAMRGDREERGGTGTIVRARKREGILLS